MGSLFRLFSDDWSAFGILTKLAVLAQLGLIVHCVRTGRPLYWIWILLIAPFIGGIAYVFIELSPDLRAPGGGWRLPRPRSMVIGELRQRLEESDSVGVRLRLAGELLAAGRPGEADAVASEALKGPFRNDPHTLTAVAQFRLENHKAAEARNLLEAVDTRADRMLEVRREVLIGRACFELGEFAAAREYLERASGRVIGEEARFWLARVELGTGRTQEGLAALRDIRTRFKRANPLWRRTERRWFREAGILLKQAQDGK